MSDDKPEECYACGYETATLKPYKRTLMRNGQEGEMWFCEICASTPSGNAFEYPAQYPEAATLKAIAYVGNMILAALATASPAAGPPEEKEGGAS